MCFVCTVVDVRAAFLRLVIIALRTVAPGERLLYSECYTCTEDLPSSRGAVNSLHAEQPTTPAPDAPPDAPVGTPADSPADAADAADAVAKEDLRPCFQVFRRFWRSGSKVTLRLAAGY